MSAHTREQLYCPTHRIWFNCLCWKCEEDVREEDTPDEREQQRVETYNDACESERIADRGV